MELESDSNSIRILKIPRTKRTLREKILGIVEYFKDTHTFLQSMNVRKCTALFLSREIKETIKPNPKIPLDALRDQLQKKYDIGVSKQKVFRAKQMTQKKILTAVGVDPNNGTYPLAYAVVESENKKSWLWFLDYLGDSLELFRNSNFTFVTDRKKYKINPCNGPDLWPPSDSPIIVTPPDDHTPIGMPPKKIKKSDAELYYGMVKDGKLSRSGKTVTCLKCGEKGHNNRSCKGQRGA
ncbi:mutator type transposase [Tanacetum coccineum]